MTTLSFAGREAVTAMARVGFAARGLLYLLVGAFGVSAAFSGDRPRGIGGVLQWLVRAPLGGAIIVALAAGIACFAGWLGVRGFCQSRRAAGGQRWLLAIGTIGDAVFYAGFVVMIFGVALRGHGGGDGDLQIWVAWLFAHASGRVLVGLAGAAVLAGGVGSIFWAWTRDVERSLALPPREKHLTEPLGRYGVTGRGAALVLVGAYLIASAIDADPTKAHGLDGALQALRQTAYGWIPLLLFALSFGAAGIFDLLEACYRRGE